VWATRLLKFTTTFFIALVSFSQDVETHALSSQSFAFGVSRSAIV
jgi:hypothetical protein